MNTNIQKIFMRQQCCDRKGVITLMSVIVTGAIGLAIALSVILLGIGATKTSFALLSSNQAKNYANACAEEALQKIQESEEFSGKNSLNFSEGTCIYNVINLEQKIITIESLGSSGSVKRKVFITANKKNKKINIILWQEVTDLLTL